MCYAFSMAFKGERLEPERNLQSVPHLDIPDACHEHGANLLSLHIQGSIISSLQNDFAA